jgi:hypothetical protein
MPSVVTKFFHPLFDLVVLHINFQSQVPLGSETTWGGHMTVWILQGLRHRCPPVDT